MLAPRTENTVSLLTFSLNVTVDGCVDHQEGIADDETHSFFTRLMDEAGAMLWGRVTYEMMESYWPAVARGDEEAAPAMWWLLVHGKSVLVDDTTYFGLASSLTAHSRIAAGASSSPRATAGQ